MQPYNIRVHSYYSLLNSILSIDDILQHAINNHLDYAILTDINNLYGAMEFYTKAVAKKIKPIIGLEITWLDSTFLLYAKNYQGFKKLITISSKIMLDEEFNLNDELDNNLFIVCLDENYSNPTLNVWYPKDIYINEVNYNNEQDNLSYQVLKAINHNEILDLKHLQNNHTCWIKEQNVSNIKQQNFQQLIHECNLVIDDFKNRLPAYGQQDSKQYLQEVALNGLMEKLDINDNKMPKEYYDRLMYELDVINELQYNDYFLIVADFISFAKRNDIIIGPGRGSAGGSLVAYALDITEIDPIKYHLIFERFLNKDRKSMPDIDVDIMDSRRDELIYYIFNKYRVENTCQIVTFQRIKHKMAIRDVGRVLNIPLNMIDTISKKIPMSIDTTLVEFAKTNKALVDFYNSYPELFEISDQLYNIPRQFSTHAAGILIANEPMSHIIPVQKGMNGFLLSQWSMEYLETFGLNKIDILGLKNLSIIYETLKLIKDRTNKTIDLKKINLNDKKIFDEIKKANTNGIFQLESPGMKATLTKIQPESIDDISLVSALFRPGPQMMINDYVKTRKDPSLIKYKNEAFKNILSSTNGFIVYQEQVIALIKVVTNFSATKADIFRRAISKKKVELFDQIKTEFIDAAIKNNYPENEANEIWNMILEFANYGFNRSHSIAYAFISYQMMYLKYYYPLEFMIALLMHDGSSNLKDNIYLSEAKKLGIKVVNIDITKADVNFKIVDDNIMLGLQSIKGFGFEMANKIVNIRKQNPFDTYEQTISTLAKNKISLKSLEVLIKIGAFDNFKVDRLFLLTNLNNIIKKFEAINPTTGKAIFDVAYEDCINMSEEEKATYENEYLGYAFSNNQLAMMFDQYALEFDLYHLNHKELPNEFNVLAQIKNIRQTMTKTGKEMAFVVIRDGEYDESIPSFNPEIFKELKKEEYCILKIRYKNNKFDILNVVKHL